jgi:hypothetical protein
MVAPQQNIHFVLASATMCKILQARKYTVSRNVADNARYVLRHTYRIFDNENQFDFEGDNLCPHSIQCMQAALAEFFPPGSFLTRVPLSDDEISEGCTNTDETDIGDKWYKLGDRTVMHCLMETVYHEHQTDDGAFWDFLDIFLDFINIRRYLMDLAGIFVEGHLDEDGEVDCLKRYCRCEDEKYFFKREAYRDEYEGSNEDNCV